MGSELLCRGICLGRGLGAGYAINRLHFDGVALAAIRGGAAEVGRLHEENTDMKGGSGVWKP